MSSDGDSYNYSIFAIPIAWFISSIARMIILQRDSESNPAIGLRQLLAVLRYVQDPQDLYQLQLEAFISRPIGEYPRGFEDIAAFTAAVLAGNFVGLCNDDMNMFALTYLICHVLYTVFDIIHETRGTTLIAFVRTTFFFCSIITIITTFTMAGCMMVEQGRGISSPSQAPVHVEGVTEGFTPFETAENWVKNLTIFCLSLSMIANSYINTLNFHSIQTLESEMKSQQKKLDEVLATMEARFKEIKTDLPARDHATQQAQYHSATIDEGGQRAGADIIVHID